MICVRSGPIDIRFTLALVSVVWIGQTLRADSADDWSRMKEIVPKGYVCYRTDSPPKIDGRLDDAAWQTAAWTDTFVDIEGDRKPAPRFRTRAKMLWDTEYFYFAVEMEEPHVSGTLTRHDSVIFHDNDFELFIDPDGDLHGYYELEINALNTGWDLFLPRPYKDGGRADDGWEISGLITAVNVDGTLNDPSDVDRGWSVEIAVPWKALREFAVRACPPGDGDQWRINFSRVEWKHEIQSGKYQKIATTREDNWVWSPQGIIDMHRPERWGYVQFSTSPAGTARFVSDPTLRARDALLEIYYAQRDFHQQHQRWASSLDQLKLDQNLLSGFKNTPTLKMSKQGYRAIVEIATADQGTKAWSIRQDSRLRLCSADDDLVDTIEGILTQQVDAWNSGDIDGFMQHYWKSDELTFSSGGRTTRGWHTTKANYKERYPTRERMGNLSFGAIEVTSLGETAALVLGRWRLQREPAPIGGNFSLLFRRIDGDWVIVHDHTSLEKTAAPDQPATAQISSRGPGDPSSTGQPDVTKPAAQIDKAASHLAVETLQQYLATERRERQPLPDQPFVAIPLTHGDASRAEHLLWFDHVARIRETRGREMVARQMTDGERKMLFYYEIFGEKPKAGRSLYISMHGGGGAPKRVNDQQWENQKKLYRLEEGVYVAPRAPTDTWNLWHEEHIDRLFGRLIENMIVFEDVNPDRVYLMGYSAGGDGVYQLAPRMADRFAAAAMMAGHPNETSPLGLRNLPFTIHVGELDDGYDRNRVAREWEQKLDELHKADPDGYVHLVTIHAGKGHWLNREDAAAIPWMAQYQRNSFPRRVVWKQDDVTHSRFYWLAVPADSMGDRAEVIAERREQQFDVQARGVQRLLVRLNDSMLDLDQPVTVTSKGQRLFRGNVERTIAVLAKTLDEYGDPRSVYSGEVSIELPKATEDQ